MSEEEDPAAIRRWDGTYIWDGEPLLKTGTVAGLFGVSDRSIRNWTDKGLLPAVKTPGGHRRYPLGAVLNFYRTRTSWGGAEYTPEEQPRYKNRHTPINPRLRTEEHETDD